jgi:hypothetical protein
MRYVCSVVITALIFQLGEAQAGGTQYKSMSQMFQIRINSQSEGSLYFSRHSVGNTGTQYGAKL